MNHEGLAAVLHHYKGRYTTVVGFQPTGWTADKTTKKGTCGRRTQKGTVVLYQVRWEQFEPSGPTAPNHCQLAVQGGSGRWGATIMLCGAVR